MLLTVTASQPEGGTVTRMFYSYFRIIESTPPWFP